MRSKLLSKLLYNWQAKILCFLLAVLVYFVLVFSIQTSRRVTLPVEVKMPSTYEAQSNIPTSVELVIQGTEDQIYMIDVSEITLTTDFTTVNREGVSYATVQINTHDLESHVDTTALHIYTVPSQLKVYFALPGAGK